MRYDPTTEIDPEEEADAWFASESVLRDETLFTINMAMGEHGVPDNVPLTVETLTDAVERVVGMADRYAGLSR